jgi:hypothetical protein
MPRISEDTGNTPDSGLDLSIPRDYCRDCYDLAVEQASFDNAWHNTQHDLDADHPPYEDEEYACEDCGSPLTRKDNYAS